MSEVQINDSQNNDKENEVSHVADVVGTEAVKKIKRGVYELLPCPFCGGEAGYSSEYESDDNSPDGYACFIKCLQCGAKGESNYCVDINVLHLSKKQREEQQKDQKETYEYVIKKWNTRK